MVGSLTDGPGHRSQMLDVQAMPGLVTRWLRAAGHAGTVADYALLTGGYSRVMARVTLDLPGGGSEVLVLRGDPPPDQAMLESDRTAEWNVVAALTELGRVRVPPARWFVDDEAWFGTKAMFVEHITSQSLQALLDGGRDHSSTADGVASLWAQVASVTPGDVPALAAPSSWDAYIDEQIGRWRALADNYVEALPIISYLAAWMDHHRPPPLPLRLVHGDPQAANVIVDGHGDWHLIDWEFARIGDPREDLGYYNAYCGAVPPNLLAEDPERFLARYRAETGFDEDAVNPATLAWFTTLSTISVVSGMHDAIAGLANGSRRGTLVAFNSLLCTVGYRNFLEAIEMIESTAGAPAANPAGAAGEGVS